MKSYVFLFLLIFSFTSCSNETAIEEEVEIEIDYDLQNEISIQQYILDNNLTVEKTDSGLYYSIEEPGTGIMPLPDSFVTVTYVITNLNGTVLGKIDNPGESYNLKQVIPGFREGLTLLKEGGSVKLIIPSKLAYGDLGQSNIRPGEVLIFDLQLLKVN
jgi:FKBP-type peptidyl-prolyl cis-trans isomerase FkpA